MGYDRRWPLGLGLAIAVAATFGCSSDFDDGLRKYPVTGSVLVDGTPAEQVRVYFVKEGGGGSSNGDYPVGVSGADGRFSMSTNGKNDGAVAGSYVVLIEWPDSNGPGAEDRLAGKYMDPQRSERRVTVAERENVLEPFELQSAKSSATRGGRPQLDENDRPPPGR